MDKIQKRPIYRYKENLLRILLLRRFFDLPHFYYEYARFLSECADREDLAVYQLTLHQAEIKYIELIVLAEVRSSPVGEVRIGNS